MAFWKKFYKSKYTGAEIDAAVAKAGTVPAVTSADAGKALVVDEEGKIVAGEAGTPDFIVNITVTENEGELTPSVDKTYEQIVAAITAGSIIKINVTITMLGTAFTMTTRDYGYSEAAGGITGNFMLYFMGALNYYALQITTTSATFKHKTITLNS